MRMQTGLFAAIALLALPFYQAAADNSFGYNMDEATRIMEAEYQHQLRLNQQSKHQRAKSQRARVSPPLKKVAIVPQRRPAPLVRPRQVLPPAHQPARVTVLQADEVPRAEELFGAATNGNVALIGRLLRQGVNINAANRERETALHMAAAGGHYSAVIYLINQGANVNALTIKNWIPLHHAVRFRHANIANYLLKRGSYAQARTSDGLTAIDMAKATKNQHMVNLLGGR